MVASSWILRADPASKEQIENWLKAEATTDYSVVEANNEVQVDFTSIDDAFRFRLQFDELLIQ